MTRSSRRNSLRISLMQPADGLVYKWGRTRTKRMPLGLAYVAAALEPVADTLKVVDAALDDLGVEEAVAQALSVDPHMVGITCTTPLFHQAVEMVTLIKDKSPRTAVVIGGPHVGALPVASLADSRADFICVGEGEASVAEIVQCVIKGRDPAGIPGIVYDWNGYQGESTAYRRRVSQPRDAFAPPIDLDRIPVPARHLFEYRRYTDGARDIEGAQTMAMFSRGCPGKCSFCGAADTIVRFRDIENVLDELEHIDKELGIRNVFITDDTYTSNRKRVLKLSRGIVERGLNLNFSVQLRLDQLDREICDAMYESGVRYVGPGIESGNEQIIKMIGKGPREDKANMLKQVRLLQDYDWRVRCSFVMGMPGETEAQILETIDFAKELGADENAFSIVVPYPDSPLWTIAAATGKVDEHMDFSKFLYYHDIGCNLSAVSTGRLLELHEFAYDYVGNPAYRLDDDSVSSGNRPHIPYLASKAFREHRLNSREKREDYAYDSTERRPGG